LPEIVTNLVLPVLLALLGGGGLWAFLTSTRSATSDEYKQFVEDLQQERRDREAALAALRKELDLERDERAEQTILIGELIHHVDRLEEVLEQNNIEVPTKPARLRMYIKASSGG
jgi:hypothetical protein